MGDIRRIVRVFLASPGDLIEERKAARAVVDDFNGCWADEFDCHVELVGWEDTVSGYGRPQAIINQDLERCELFVGMMWRRWGTQPDVSGKFTSGFEEEFEISVDRRRTSDRPEISLFFKEIDADSKRDPGDELKKVLAFREKLISRKDLLFSTFSDIKEFEDRLRRRLVVYIRALRKRESVSISAQNQAPTTDGDAKPIEETTNSPSKSPFSAEGVAFLREFLSKSEKSSEEEINAVEIARFRLLGNLLSDSGNDKQSLGVHDANLLFSKGQHFNFGRQELDGLIANGCEKFRSASTPLWHWLVMSDRFVQDHLAYSSFFSRIPERRTGALAAMRLISEPLPSNSDFTRSNYVSLWFDDENSDSVKLAALAYLADEGITDDLPIIREEFKSKDSQISSAAADAIIRILSRDSRDQAIEALFELQPDTVKADTLTALFSQEDTFRTETLLLGLNHRSAEVRRKCVLALYKRHFPLPAEDAERLLADSDAKIRYNVLRSLVETGRIYSDKEVENILVKQPPDSTGFFGLGGMAPATDLAGKACWDQFKIDRLRSLKIEELEALRGNSHGVFERHIEFALVERQFKKRAAVLRGNIDDFYKSDFANGVQYLTQIAGEHSDLLESTRSLEESIRKSLTRRGLDIICENGDPADLRRVRTVLRSGFIPFSDADIEYLRRRGEWEDIPLLIDAAKQPQFENFSASLLLSSLSNDPRYLLAARAIYALGRTRLCEVLSMQMPSGLLCYLIAEISDSVFRDIEDHAIAALLASTEDTVRKVTALKAIRSIPKSRLSQMLAAYISSSDTQYYNVVHWLDFGVSMPKDRVLPATEKVLKRWKR